MILAIHCPMLNTNLPFRLYDAADGGLLLWEEEQDIILTRGIVSTVLGKNTPLNIPFDKPYWLGLQFDGDPELLPRTQLTASPYAINATATLIQPEPGQTLMIRDLAANPTHRLEPDGSSVHSGVGMFMGGIQVPFDSLGSSGNISPEDPTRSSLEGYTLFCKGIAGDTWEILK